MHKHKILYIHEEAKSVGGGSSSILQLVKALDRSQFEPIVLCPKTWGLRHEAERANVRVVPSWLPSWTKGKSLPFIIPAILRLIGFLKREEICLIFYCGFHSIPFGYFATRFVPIPTVCRLYRERGREKKWKMKAYFVRSPSRFVIVNTGTRGGFENSGIEGAKIKVIHHGVDLDEIGDSIGKAVAREKLGIKSDIPVILSMGRFVPFKGYQYLIEAVALIKKKVESIKLIILAEKPGPSTDETSRKYYESLNSLVAKRSLRQNVEFVGFKYGDEKKIYLSAMDVFVLPSIDEDFGIVLLEAMAMRRPVVASNGGGVPEVVENGETGILVQAADSTGISRAILELIQDPEKSLNMGEKGRKRLETFFTLQQEAREHQKLYDTLLTSCT